MDRHLGPAALVQWLHRMRHDQAARSEEVGDSAQLRLETDDEAVQLVTVHRSKGLQYDVVYAPYLWDGKLLRDSTPWWLYHDGSQPGQLVIDLNKGGDGETRAEVEALAESLRLFYVAVTRARHLCRCVWGVFNEAATSPLSYLLHGGAGAGDIAAWMAAAHAEFKSLASAPEQLRAPLDRLVAASQGSIAVRAIRLDQAAQRSVCQAQDVRDLQPAILTRDPPRGHSVSSYSSLVASSERVTEDEADRDRAPVVERGPVALDSSTRIALHDLAGGAGLGRAVHAVLEHSNLALATAPELRATLDRALGVDRAFDAPSRERLADALLVLLERPLDAVAPGFCLRQIAPERSLVELPFQLTIAPQVFTSPRSTVGVTTEQLACLFEDRANDVLGRRYGALLRQTGIRAPAGYLGGFVDLVFEHGGRWYVVDYKTNFLGPRVADYDPVHLDEAMLEHHYVLQYHLYTLALHRYLRWRRNSGQPDLASYSYARHFGGVLYLFVRGMCEGAPEGCGVFFDRPADALIEDLDQVFEGCAEVRA
ncbi:MAG: 3'-5' exonuclease [Pseudomonadota bacterium]